MNVKRSYVIKPKVSQQTDRLSAQELLEFLHRQDERVLAWVMKEVLEANKSLRKELNKLC